MKKIFSQSALIILSAVMVVCISACASKKGVQPKGEEPKVAEKAVEKEPKAPAVEEPADVRFAKKLQKYLNDGDRRGAIACFDNMPKELEDKIDLKLILGALYFSDEQYENAVDVAIVDSPLLLNIIYNHDPRLGEHFNEMVANVYSKFDNIDVLLPPPPIDKKYSTVGRVHSLEASQNLHARIKTMLNDYKINYQEVSRDDLSWIDNIISNLEEDK